MIKKCFVLCLLTVLCLSLSMPIFAAPAMPYFVDETGLVDKADISALNDRAETLAVEYGCGLPIWLVEEVSEDIIDDTAVNTFYDNAYGAGASESGLILVLSVYTGDYSLIPFGDAEEIFSEATYEEFINSFADAYMADEYLDAFTGYYDLCVSYLSGEPVAPAPAPVTDTITVPGLIPGVKPAYVYDGAGFLTAQETAELNARAQAITNKFNCEIAVITLADMKGDAFTNAMDIFDKYDYGYGAERSGILLLVSKSPRAFAFVTYGYANTAFTDIGQEKVEDWFLYSLSNNEYVRAFTRFFDRSEQFLQYASEGRIVGVDFDPDVYVTTTNVLRILAVLVPLLVAYILCSMWKKQMQTAVKQTTANAYIPAGGFTLTGQNDTFLYRTETRRKIETSSSSGGGRGGTSTNSRGFSGRSGKY